MKNKNIMIIGLIVVIAILSVVAVAVNLQLSSKLQNAVKITDNGEVAKYDKNFDGKQDIIVPYDDGDSSNTYSAGEEKPVHVVRAGTQ